MKLRFFLFCLTACFLVCQNSTSSTKKSSFLQTVKGAWDVVPKGYVPPLISNGSLTMLIDYRGGQDQQKYAGQVPAIYWAGRRYGPELIPFGHFDLEIEMNGRIYKEPLSWVQTLDKQKATVTCLNDYDDIGVETVVFTHLLYDVVVVKKKFFTASIKVQPANVKFRYQFTPPGNDNRLPKKTISECSMDTSPERVKFQYEIDGYHPYKGVVLLFADTPFDADIDRQIVTMSTKIDISLNKPVEIVYYLLFSDSMDGDDYTEKAGRLQSYIRQTGYENLLNIHAKEWLKYWRESFVQLPDAQMEKVYNTAQYHLRANATKWSFPVGVFPTHWQGRYFGWDETFCFQALASSNHLSVSRRCPEYRFAGLQKATSRVAHYGKPGLYGARYPWETFEDGSDGTPPGFWIEHVFHMATITVSAWLQYLYTNDLDYLKTIGFPVIRECARFFTSHMVYKDSDRSMFIGKCTDLERLGPAVQNPFLTACGVIYTLEAAASAAKLLDENKEEMNTWKNIAEKLRENLPHDGNMYLPYLGCKEKSIASLGGLFPFPVFDETNLFERNAVYDFVENGKASGNMYPMGASVCAWYAGWISSALALLDDRKIPLEIMADAAKSAGCFAELFEINEPGIAMHPWFSTASGNYVYAINQMLIQSKDDQIRIAPAVPDTWKDYSFSLACYGNLTATVVVKEGKIAKLSLASGHFDAKTNRTLIIPSYLVTMEQLKKEAINTVELQDGYCYIHFDVKGQIQIF